MSDHFAITGVDFAGPVHYKKKKSNTGKSYITLCTCASTRAVDLKLCCDFSSIGFQRALKEFIARGKKDVFGHWDVVIYPQEGS